MKITKSINAVWLGAKFRLKLNAIIIFPFRLDIPGTKEFNLCRAVISVKDISWMKRPVDLRIVQRVLVDMSRRTTHPNLFTQKADAPYFVHHKDQDSDFYIKYNLEKEHYELISITPTQDLYNDNGDYAEVYRFGLER